MTGSSTSARSIDADLAAIVGQARVAPAGAEDAIRGVQPMWVVEPAAETELAEVLRYATAHDLRVAPRGGGTKTWWGQPPRQVDIVVSTKGLHRVLDHPWADLTVSVEAGCTIADVRQVLQSRGQRIACDPLWPDRATVGGVLSTNDTGALRLRFGGLRDLVIGATLALADGTLASSGGRVVKNVAGYDLPKLATGALGTIGIITRAIFRLHPMPARATTLSRAVENAADVWPLLAAIRDSTLTPSAVQVRTVGGAATVDVLLEGSEAGISAQAGALGREWRPADASIWSARQDLFDVPGTVVKVSVLPSAWPAVVESLESAARSGDSRWAAVLYGHGLGWIGVQGDDDRVLRIVDDLRALARLRGGSLTIVRPAAGTAGADVWGPAGDAADLMRAVKRQFDPAAILNPGRFVAGI